MAHFIVIILGIIFGFLFHSSSINAEMHCLVIRPGFGLVSELCPAHTVSCRIRIERDAISFYEYSPLYDRNQFVCVLKGELGNQNGSGCVRKRSGHIRCWCFGRSNCNTPENSKLLFSTFINGDEAKFLEAIQQVDFADLIEESQNFDDPKNAAISTTTTPITKITQKFMQKASEIKENISTIKSGKDEEGNEKQTMEIIKPTTTKMYSKLSTTINSAEKGKMATKTSTKRPPITTSASSNSFSANDRSRNQQNSSQKLRSEFDRHNRIHIIHVSARDRYEPVNVFGSPALQRIMEKERKLLKTEVEKSSNESEEEEDEQELEELEENWEWEEENEKEKEGENAMDWANQPKKIAERSQKQQKPSKNNSMLKIRMEQRQRSPNSASTEIEEEKELAEEYFDSALYAKTASSSHKFHPIIFFFLFPLLLMTILC